MRNLIRTALVLLFGVFSISAAQASQDSGCPKFLTKSFSAFSSCDGTGYLTPSNDTRTNMIYLMADAQGQRLIVRPGEEYPTPGNFDPAAWTVFSAEPKPTIAPTSTEATDETSGEGTICVSDGKGREQFIAAVTAANDISVQEKLALTEARKALSCIALLDSKTFSADAITVPRMLSTSAKEFAAYFSAVSQFYKSTHADAAAFVALSNAGQPWVKEAANYMGARALLLNVQENAFDEYGTIAAGKVDALAVGKALDGLNSYLKAYPSGAYAASATGLLRRAYWLGGDRPKQLESYSKIVIGSGVNSASVAVAGELDFKLPIEAFTDIGASPIFLAVQDLRLMRGRQEGEKLVPGLSLQELEAQRPRFSANPELFEYLLAARAWFSDKDAKAVLKLLPEKAAPETMSYLKFSSQFLRAAAMDALGDGATRNAYVALFAGAKSVFQRPVLELALAMHDERHKNIGAVFEPNSLITDSEIRNQLLDFVAGPIILRQQATATTVSQNEREVALRSLLSHDLVHGHFKGFLEDIKLLPAKVEDDPYSQFRWEGSAKGYICPDLIAVAKRLNSNAKDVAGRMCLGEFFRTQSVGFMTFEQKDNLGGTGTLFSGAPLFRDDFYIDIMKDRSAPRRDKAYALYRAVRCYEPIHNNDCGGKDVNLAVRKGWYNELKKNYGDTPWAKELGYYW